MVLLCTLGTKKFPSKNCNTIIIIRIINTFDGLETMVKNYNYCPSNIWSNIGIMSVIPIITPNKNA